MKIAIDTSPLTIGHKVRGIGVHTKELITALEKLNQKKVKVESVDFSKTNLSKYDVVHYQYFHPFFLTLPKRKPTRKVIVTIHDLIPLIYPKKYPPGIRGRINFMKQKRRLKNVDAIITISETSKKDICRFLRVEPEKVHVVYLAPKEIFKKVDDRKKLEKTRKKFDLPKKFALFVGDVNYNKNIPTLLAGCKKAKMPLVFCGKQAMEVEDLGLGIDVLGGPMDWMRFLFNIPHPENAHYVALVNKFKSNGDIKRLGFVPDEDLVNIYNLASVYVQPSFYEGFGLPILEAVACETPVVASKIQAHVEIAGDAIDYFDPKKVESLSKALAKIGREKRDNRVLDNLRKYSWKKTAEETIEAYKTLL